MKRIDDFIEKLESIHNKDEVKIRSQIFYITHQHLELMGVKNVDVIDYMIDINRCRDYNLQHHNVTTLSKLPNREELVIARDKYFAKQLIERYRK